MTHQQGENQPGQGQPGQAPYPPQQGGGQQGQNPQHQTYQQHAPQQPQAYGQQYAQHQQQYAQQGSAPSAASAHDPRTGHPQTAQAPSGGNFLADAFEPGFAKKATVKHARWYYLLVVIVILVSWLGKTVLDFVEGAADHSGFLMGGGGYAGPFAEASYNPWPGLYTLFVGGAIAFSLIILARVFLENTIANSKISERAGEKDG